MEKTVYRFCDKLTNIEELKKRELQFNTNDSCRLIKIVYYKLIKINNDEVGLAKLMIDIVMK